MEKLKLHENMILKKILVAGSIALGIYLVFQFLLPLVFPFVVAGIVSVLYYPFLRKRYSDNRFLTGRRKKWFLAFAVVFLYLVILLIIGGLCFYLIRQGQSVIRNFSIYQEKMLQMVEECCCQMDIFLRLEGEKVLHM